MDDLVKKLRKAGINASLVHRIHDETMINIKDTWEDTKRMFEIAMEGSGVGFDVSALKPVYKIPDSEEFAGFKVGELSGTNFILPRISPNASPLDTRMLQYLKEDTDTHNLKNLTRMHGHGTPNEFE